MIREMIKRKSRDKHGTSSQSWFGSNQISRTVFPKTTSTSIFHICMSCDEPPSSPTRRSQPSSSRGPPTPKGQAAASAAEAKPVSHKVRDSKVEFNPESKTTFKWPWHEIDNQPRPPTGAQICRHLDIPNQGPCPPTVSSRGRDHDPAKEKYCIHEFNNHGGNRKAFWVQCSGCKMHLEYYPRAARGMQEVITMLEEFKDLEAQIKGWQPRKQKGSNKKTEDPEAKISTSSRATPSSTSTTLKPTPSRPLSRQQMDEQDEQEDWEELSESPARSRRY